MDIFACGSRASRRQPADWFTGTVWQDPIIEAPAPARVRSVRVSFEPGARTAWHTHPLGQTLYVVWIPPGEKHWHGASPTAAMVHVAIQEAQDGKAVEWLEHVTDQQYAVQP